MNPHVRLAFLFSLALSVAFHALASDVPKKTLVEPSLQTQKSVPAVASSPPETEAASSFGSTESMKSPDSSGFPVSPDASDSSLFFESSEPDASSPAPESPESTALENDFQTLMHEIRNVSPILYEKLQSRSRVETLTALFQALDAGILVETEAPSASPDSDDIIPASVFELADGRVFCLRIDRLDAASLDILKTGDFPRSQKGAAGLIVDLRACIGGDQEIWKDFALALRATGRPLCILTSGRTTGSSELLVPFLRKECVWIGRPTRGEAFPFIVVSAADGKWRIPAIKPGEADFLSWKGEPDFAMDPFPQVALNQFDDEESLRKDACLSFARDILVAKSLLDRGR